MTGVWSGWRLAVGLGVATLVLGLCLAIRPSRPQEDLSPIPPLSARELAVPTESSAARGAETVARAPVSPPPAPAAVRVTETAPPPSTAIDPFRQPPSVFQASVEKLDWYRSAIASSESAAEHRFHVWMLSQIAVATVLDARGLYEEPWPGEAHEHRARGAEDYVFTYNRRTYRVEREDFPELGELAALDPEAQPSPELVERVLARAAEARAILAAHEGSDR